MCTTGCGMAIAAAAAAAVCQILLVGLTAATTTAGAVCPRAAREFLLDGAIVDGVLLHPNAAIAYGLKRSKGWIRIT